MYIYLFLDINRNKNELSASKSTSKDKEQYQKTPQDDIHADFPLVDDEQNAEDEQKNDNDKMNDNDMDNDDEENDGIDLNNTLFAGSKLMKSSFVDNYQKSLRHEVFTYNDINELNPDNINNINSSKNEEEKINNNNNNNIKVNNKKKYEMDDIINDNQLSKYAKRKLKKYRKLGNLIERSRDSDLCIVTMPFPRAEYTSYEYMKILQSLTPKNMNNLIFVRGNQDQVLTFAL